jgi:hypothetical protein
MWQQYRHLFLCPVEEDSQNFMVLGTPLASKVLLMQLQNLMCRYKKGIYTNRWFLYSTQDNKSIHESYSLCLRLLRDITMLAR